mmetsp:Transcript_14879/g.47374  ORF Transcript_14879/g.47374 Transcript_14879/m.47374 type:complete len:308 (+) Transcript_14879:859-1782(+)
MRWSARVPRRWQASPLASGCCSPPGTWTRACGRGGGGKWTNLTRSGTQMRTPMRSSYEAFGTSPTGRWSILRPMGQRCASWVATFGSAWPTQSPSCDSRRSSSAGGVAYPTPIFSFCKKSIPGANGVSAACASGRSALSTCLSVSRTRPSLTSAPRGGHNYGPIRTSFVFHGATIRYACAYSAPSSLILWRYIDRRGWLRPRTRKTCCSTSSGAWSISTPDMNQRSFASHDHVPSLSVRVRGNLRSTYAQDQLCQELWVLRPALVQNESNLPHCMPTNLCSGGCGASTLLFQPCKGQASSCPASQSC